MTKPTTNSRFGTELEPLGTCWKCGSSLLLYNLPNLPFCPITVNNRDSTVCSGSCSEATAISTVISRICPGQGH